MSKQELSEESVRLQVRNVGGIDETEVALGPGVTALTGRNATNRTSLLQAVMAGLGSENVSLKGDADEGEVTLEFDGETYTRHLSRRNGTVVLEGDPYLEDPAVADLFAFLLESNEARRAVARGDDLREVIMRPVDTAAIQREIEDLEEERRRIDSRIEECDERERELPDLEERRADLREQITEKEEELAEKEAEIEQANANVEETREDKRELESKLAELRDTRADLEESRSRMRTERESVEALEAEREELETELEGLPEAPVGEKRELQSEIERLRERKRGLDSKVNQLQTIVQFNEDMLEGTSAEVLSALREGEDDAGDVTDRLVNDDGTVVCWTCGSEVERTDIEATIDRLRELRQEQLSERNRVRARIDELQEEVRDLEDKQRERERVERKLDSVEDELDSRRERIEELGDREDSLIAAVEDLEEEVEALQSKEFGDVLDLHKEANQLEFELGRLRSELDDAGDRVDEVEAVLEERSDLRERREEVQDRLTDLRTKVDRTEAEAVSKFNDHMADLLDRLDYANLERVWIERTERTVREGRRKVSRSSFDLHIVRSTASGTTYEDTIDHLSESEREVTGLVFALAGYLVHDVHETVPFIILDSLEAIDSERIAELVDYMAEFAPYLVVALLPEDAAALDGGYERLTEI
jgi:chromosome segregation ATPase